MSERVDALVQEMLTNPEDDQVRLVLADALEEAGRWTIHETLQLVLAHPDNDAPRLLYALWCDRTANMPRTGEFIRTQIEISRINERGHIPDNSIYLILENRYNDLMAVERHLFHEEDAKPGWLPPRWRAVLSLNLNYHRPQAIYRRGFAEIVNCTGEDWIREGQKLTSEQPVREVFLTTWPEITAYSLDELYPLQLTNPPSAYRNHILFMLKNTTNAPAEITVNASVLHPLGAQFSSAQAIIFEKLLHKQFPQVQKFHTPPITAMRNPVPAAQPSSG